MKRAAIAAMVTCVLGCSGGSSSPPGSSCTGAACDPSPPTPPSASCTTHEACLPAGLCDPWTHACASTIPCSPTATCPDGWRCLESRCEPEPSGACASDADCADGATCRAGLCVGCGTTGAVCGGDYASCDAPANACQACASDAECPADFAHCTAAGCAECTQASDCPAATPICNAGRCVECASNSDCSLTSECWAGTCQYQFCTSSADCPAASPHCYGNACVACRSDADCDGGKTCLRYGCVTPRPAEACSTALPLTLVGGRAELVVDANGYACPPPRTDDGLPVCLGGTVYYRFTLDAESRFLLSLGWDAGARPPWAWLKRAGCASDIAWFRPESQSDVELRYLTPGEYVLELEQHDAAPVTLVALATPVELPRGETCLDPTPLVLDASGNATATGDLLGHHDVALNPVDQGDLDAVYELDLAVPSTVELTGTTLNQNSSRVDVTLRDDCLAPPPETTCNNSFLPVTRTYGPVPAGRHLVIVNEREPTWLSGYRLDVHVQPW